MSMSNKRKTVIRSTDFWEWCDGFDLKWSVSVVDDRQHGDGDPEEEWIFEIEPTANDALPQWWN